MRPLDVVSRAHPSWNTPLSMSWIGSRGGDNRSIVSVNRSNRQYTVNCVDNTAGSTTSTVAEGFVIASQANFVRVKVQSVEGSSEGPPKSRLLCVVRAWLKKVKREVLVGDNVRIVGIDWVDGRGMVEDVLPRKTRLLEPPVANITNVLLLFSLEKPPFQPASATRYLLAVENAGLPVTVALNKTDLLSEDEVEEYANRIREWGYPVVTASVMSGRGLEDLENALNGAVTVIAGPSGAGKSSIINALRLKAAGMPFLLDSESHLVKETKSDSGEKNKDKILGIELQAVGEVSDRVGRGKHTTRNVSLIEMAGGGFVADTPGFNQPSLSIPPSQLANYFPEIRQIHEAQGPCLFKNCLHLNEPGCVVRENDGWERYPMYVSLMEEMKLVEAAKIQRSTSKKAREGSVRYKTRAGGRVAAEARLETKSHRRVSRRAVRQALSDMCKDVEEDSDDENNLYYS